MVAILFELLKMHALRKVVRIKTKKMGKNILVSDATGDVLRRIRMGTFGGIVQCVSKRVAID